MLLGNRWLGREDTVHHGIHLFYDRETTTIWNKSSHMCSLQHLVKHDLSMHNRQISNLFFYNKSSHFEWSNANAELGAHFLVILEEYANALPMMNSPDCLHAR